MIPRLFATGGPIKPPPKKTTESKPDPAPASGEQQKIKPAEPMLFGPAGKLAKDIFAKAKQQGALDAVSESFNKFREAYTSKDQLKFDLNEPLKGDDKTKYFKKLEKQLGVHPIFIDLLQTLHGQGQFKTGKLTFLKDVEIYFSGLKAYDLKEVVSVITSAEPLSKEQLAKLQGKIKTLVDPACKIVYNTKVDPALIGGLTVVIGDRFQDLSVRRTVEHMKRSLGRA